jgi:hypothetical protein
MSWFFWSIIVFLVYWLILFVFCFIVSDYSQKFLYDEATPYLGLKIAGGTFLMAILMARFKPSYDTMFTSNIHWTLLQAMIWTAIFIFVFRFHPKHAVALALGTFLVIGGMATIGVNSMMGETPAETHVQRAVPAKPLRKPAYPSPLPIPEKANAEPAK